LAVAARANLAMADSKRSKGTSRAATGQSSQRFQSSGPSRFLSPQVTLPKKQLSSDAYKTITPMPTAKRTLVDQSKLKDAIVPMPGAGRNVLPNTIPAVPLPGAGSSIDPSAIKPVPLPQSNDPLDPNGLQPVPFPMPGDPGNNPDPMPQPDPDPQHCHPWSTWPTWWWFSPIYGHDHYCTPQVIVQESVVIAAPVIDVEFLAVRLVDIGDLEKGLGPQYRVRFRNNSTVVVTQPFHVTMLVGNGQKAESLPHVTEPVAAMAAGEVRELDLRLPLAANQLAIKGASASLLYPLLSVAIDANEELAESNELNNRATFDRAEIPVVED
jgi:hypothetical protein